MRPTIKLLSLAATAQAAACAAPVAPARAPVAMATVIRASQPPEAVAPVRAQVVATTTTPVTPPAMFEALLAVIGRPLLMPNGRPAPGNVQKKGDMDDVANMDVLARAALAD